MRGYKELIFWIMYLIGAILLVTQTMLLLVCLGR